MTSDTSTVMGFCSRMTFSKETCRMFPMLKRNMTMIVGRIPGMEMYRILAQRPAPSM